MSLLPDDPLDLMLLKHICSGHGVETNIAHLSRLLGRHEKTMRDRVKKLLDYGIVNGPVFPFRGLFNEYPLLVISYSDLPYDGKTIRWLKEDRNIFAAYRVREGESNTVIFEFHKDVWDYHVWRDEIAAEGKIPGRGTRAPSNNYYFSNRGIFKYEPSVAIELIKDEFKRRRRMEINGYELDEAAIRVLECLLKGEGIRVNENLLAKELGVTRKTVSSRISKLREKGLILGPLCRFPHFFVPPNFLLFLALIEAGGSKDRVMQEFLSDPHISLAYHISEGRYNLLLFECHESIEDYLKWENSYTERFPGCFGSMKLSILSPRMTILIDQQKVSLGLISSKLEEAESLAERS
jgi:DNA-binding Lrp family transcriptional regulator